jgi:glycosyltransferase involved in cell wall biosynthesis
MLLVNDVTHDQRIYRIAHSLRDAGAEVCIYGRLRPWSKSIDWKGIKIQRFELGIENGPLMYYRMNQHFAREGRKEQWDVVVSNDFDTLWAGKKIAKKCSAKWVLDAHELFTEVPELQGKPMKKFIWHRLGKWLIPNVDLAMTVSPSISNELGLKYGQKFHSIPNVPFKRKAAKIHKRKNVILYQGAINKGRGLELAIKAMHQIEGLKLVIAGEGDLSAEVRKLVREDQLEAKVEFLGMVKPKELRSITKTAWLGLNLLTSESTNYYYSLANKFFDYAQAGIPSINMDFPEYRRLIEEYNCGRLLSTLKIEAYVNLVRSLQSDEKEYQKLCQGALALAEDYHWEKYEPKLIELYESLFS